VLLNDVVEELAEMLEFASERLETELRWEGRTRRVGGRGD